MSKPRKGGRPRAGQQPKFDRALLERLLVEGEAITSPDGTAQRQYPSYRELAKRFGVSNATIHAFSERHRCLERRRGGAAEATEPASPAGRSDERPLRLTRVRELFDKWIDDARGGRIEVSSAGEIEKAMRVAADLDAEAAMRAMIPDGIPTLEELQDLHEQLRAQWEATTPGMRGEVPLGVGSDDSADTVGAAEC